MEEFVPVLTGDLNVTPHESECELGQGITTWLTIYSTWLIWESTGIGNADISLICGTGGSADRH